MNDIENPDVEIPPPAVDPRIVQDLDAIRTAAARAIAGAGKRSQLNPTFRRIITIVDSLKLRLS